MPPDLNVEHLRDRRLFIGTPMYSGQCCSQFALSIAQLSALCTQLGVTFRFCFVCHEALVPKARNVIADQFLQSGDDALVFIDADIGFDARDVIHLLALQFGASGGDFDVIAAPYPLKDMAWENVREAARRGLADQDAGTLARYASNVVLKPAHVREFPIDRPVEVEQAGTGLMMIRRATFERFRDAYPQRRYRPDRTAADTSPPREIHAFFETEIDSKHGNILDEAKAYLACFPEATHDEILAFLESENAVMQEYSGGLVSEDYAFCRRLRRAGMKVWLCPWMELNHTGSHTYAGRIPELAGLGAI